MNIEPDTDNTLWGVVPTGGTLQGAVLVFAAVDTRAQDVTYTPDEVVENGDWASITFAEGVDDVNLCGSPGQWNAQWQIDGETIVSQLVNALPRTLLA